MARKEDPCGCAWSERGSDGGDLTEGAFCEESGVFTRLNEASAIEGVEWPGVEDTVGWASESEKTDELSFVDVVRRLRPDDDEEGLSNEKPMVPNTLLDPPFRRSVFAG